jgi:hypothetical protein
MPLPSNGVEVTHFSNLLEKRLRIFRRYRPSTARPKRQVKYRDGENVWSGVGSMPAWAKLKGDALDSLADTISTNLPPVHLAPTPGEAHDNRLGSVRLGVLPPNDLAGGSRLGRRLNCSPAKE